MHWLRIHSNVVANFQELNLLMAAQFTYSTPDVIFACHRLHVYQHLLADDCLSMCCLMLVE
jgi:hypothetical protein